MVFTALELPPLDYSLVFPDLLNFHMERNPSFPVFVYTDLDTLVEISMLEFTRAAHRVAHAIRPTRQGQDGEVVAIIANTDTILYQAVVAGLSLSGWVPFPISPRNSAAAVVNMMKKTNCFRIVTVDHAHDVLINGIHRANEGIPLSVYELPTLQYAFPKLGEEVAADTFIPYPAGLNCPDLDSPAIYIHSSGSTGFPKPIVHSYRIQIQWFAHPLLGIDSEFPAPRRIGAMALPPFHASGIATQLYMPIAYLVTAVVFPPLTNKDPIAQPVIPTSDNTIECLKKTACNVFITVPAFLEQMVTSEKDIEVLKNVDSVRFGGGPLPVKVGDTLWAAGVRLASLYSGTEFGSPIAFRNEREVIDSDWMWLRFLEDVKTRWAPVSDGTYELQILSTEDRKMAVENLPDAKGYATSDIFVKHPTKDLWKIVGRADDVIVLASGEKTVPAPIESVIGSSPQVQGVVMFGRERNQVGVLIEPRMEHAVNVNDAKAVAEFRNQIWPVIEEANKPSPTFSRIFKEMILITNVDKPMLRVAKGTVQRKATLDAYEIEISALYDTVEVSSVTPEGLAGPLAWTSEVLGEWLLEHARAISPNFLVDPYRDLFAQGFDSLSATYLRNQLLSALRKSSDPEIKEAATRIPPNIIFENPTIQLLSSRIAALVNNSGAGQVLDLIAQHKLAINSMIKKYSIDLDGPIDGILPSSHLIKPAVVLLTGTTGGLGSSLLLELLRNPTIQRVYTFNRPSVQSIQERQRSAFKERRLPVELLDMDKLVHIIGDASLEKCGLSLAQYDEIRNSVTLIIHSAWRLDFNLAVASFEDNVRASRNLVQLGLDSPHKHNLRFLFTSSVGSAQSWDNSRGPCPEDVQFDPAIAVGIGYGEAKYVVERIVARSGLHATSLRIGQITGGLDGCWATTDWFPILIKSSMALGALPEIAGVVSWLRTQDVAAAILEMGFANETLPPVLNMVNPRSVPWAAMIASVRRAIVQRKALGPDALPIVPLGNWFALLEAKAENASEGDLETIPAVKLLEFIRMLVRGDQDIRNLGLGNATEMAGMANVSTAKAQLVSPAMAKMQAIGEHEVNAWVECWISKGAF